jgi:formylglycine-generating enzyme required for sulfatase activity
MTLQTKKAKDAAAPGVMPIILSAAQPGVGQFMQRRWIAGTFYCVAFMVCLILVVIPIFKALWQYWQTAFEFLDRQPNQSIAGISWRSVAIPLVTGMVIWIVGIVDTFIAYRHDCEAWSRRKFDERIGKTVVVALFVLCMLTPNLTRAAASADLFNAISSNDLVRAEAILKDSSPTTLDVRIGDGITALHVAAAKNSKDMVSLFIRNGAHLDATTTGGFTALHWAASKDASDAASLLIKAGADVNAANPQGVTPLHWAASRNATNVVMLLLAAGADANAKTTTGFTPLHWARMQRASEAAVIIADKLTSDEMANDTNGPPLETTAKPESAEATQRVATAVVVTTIHPESQHVSASQPVPMLSVENNLTVPLGHDEELVLVWIKELGIWVGKFDITNGQYRRYSPEHSSRFREKFNLDGRNQPVVYVSWTDAVDFCKWLDKNCGYRLPANCEFRLPTGNEWIAFARCGGDRKYPWGSELPPKYGNYCDLSAKGKLSDWKGFTNYDDGFVVSCPVEESGSNEWGIYGVGGNVWQWCNDWYDVGNKYKARHGGSWDYEDDASLTVETPGFDQPDTRDDTIGFRVVVSPKK